MKIRAKKLLGIVLCAVIMIGSAAGILPAAADNPTEYNLWIGDTHVTSANLSGAGWVYDPATSTLTLDKAEITTSSEHVIENGNEY